VKAKLIFKPASSGNPAESGTQLLDLLRHLQTAEIQAQVIIVQPEMHPSAPTNAFNAFAQDHHDHDQASDSRDGRRRFRWR
jgi:hypothetical protein